MNKHPRVDESFLKELESMDSVDAMLKILVSAEEGVRIARQITEMAQHFPEIKDMDVGFGENDRVMMDEFIGRATKNLEQGLAALYTGLEYVHALKDEK